MIFVDAIIQTRSSVQWEFLPNRPIWIQTPSSTSNVTGITPRISAEGARCNAIA